jgi:hypothetical protein
VQAGATHHLKLAIADAGDSIYDSNVFIGSKSLVSSQYAVTLTPASIQNMASCGSSANYLLELRNTGGVTDSFDLNLSGNVWPTVFDATGTGAMSVGPLNPLATTTISVTVSIPANVCTGHDAALVTAASAGAPDVFAQSTLASSADSKRVLSVSSINLETGSGSVASTSPVSPSIVCPGTCTANYPYGTPVNLRAYPSWHSTVVWTGCTIAGNDCSMVMISDFSPSASFFPLLTVMRSGPTSKEYNTIQSAYDASVTGDTLLAQKQTYYENLVFNQPLEIALKGGLNSSYLPASGDTVIEGSLTISNGKVSVDTIVIK